MVRRDRLGGAGVLSTGPQECAMRTVIPSPTFPDIRNSASTGTGRWWRYLLGVKRRLFIAAVFGACCVTSTATRVSSPSACAGDSGATVDMVSYELQGTSCDFSNIMAVLASWQLDRSAANYSVVLRK